MQLQFKLYIVIFRFLSIIYQNSKDFILSSFIADSVSVKSDLCKDNCTKIAPVVEYDEIKSFGFN